MQTHKILLWNIRYEHSGPFSYRIPDFSVLLIKCAFFENWGSYIADIGDVLVLIAKRKETEESRHHIPTSNSGKPQQRVVCHVLQSPEAEMMSSALGQAFQLAFQIFLQQNGIPAPPEGEQNQELAEMYHDDLVHYSKVSYGVRNVKYPQFQRENAKEVWIEKRRGEALGVALVESGWGSILPTVILGGQLKNPLLSNHNHIFSQYSTLISCRAKR